MASFHLNLHGRSLLGRVLLGIATLAVAVLLFFFVAAALVVGTVAGIALLARLLWLKRGLKQEERQTEVITTEYTVIERETPAQPRLPDEIQADSRKEG